MGGSDFKISDTCACIDAYYFDENFNCQACFTSKCKTCNDTECLSCFSETLIKDESICSVKDGYYYYNDIEFG